MSNQSAKPQKFAAPLAFIRGFILVILLLGMLGTGVELLLVGHTEDPWQWVPLLLIALSVVVLIWHAVVRRAASVRVFQATMILFMLSGVIGVWLHYQGKVAFKLETNPALAGLELFWAAIEGVAPPLLAPGTMLQMGLLGLAYTYRHPAVRRSSKDPSTITGE